MSKPVSCAPWRAVGAFLFGAALVLSASGVARADVASPLTGINGFGIEVVPYAVTDSGVVAGYSFLTLSSPYTTHAFRWTPTGGMVDLGTFGGSSAAAFGVSADGSVVAGYAYLSGDHAIHAFRWTPTGGMVDLGTLGGNSSLGQGLSADGNVVVGYSITGSAAAHAFRWTQAGGMADLGTLGGSTSLANGASADGSVVVGYSFLSGNSVLHVFRWTQAGGMADLGGLGGSRAYSGGVSADGNVVVGYAYLPGDSITHSFRWTQASGMVDLGTLGGSQSQAAAVSADGSVVVGVAYPTGSSAFHAFRWTQASGMQDLNTLLSQAGVNMTGVTLTAALGISPNGKYIVGYGTFPGSTLEGYLVCYDPSNSCIGLTTASKQQAATQQLADHSFASAVESRATASELLGMTRPMNDASYVQAGGMVGSAIGYTAGQASGHGVTVLGGVAYGSREYKDVRQANATTVAAAARYTFDDPFGDAGDALHPYAEAGGWVTPRASLTLTRPYANGAGTGMGVGSTEATSWAEYGRGGLIWDVTDSDRITGYGELGRQSMAYAPYSEAQSLANPFPASVESGVMRLNIARAGTEWTHRIDGMTDEEGRPLPVRLTLAGDAARSFASQTRMTASVSGIGRMNASSVEMTWGEFGARAEMQLPDNLSLALDLNGATGGGALGTTLHGGASVSYQLD